MSPVLLASLLNNALIYGPQAVALVAKLTADIQAGRTQTTVTEADLLELARLAGQNSDAIYARLGITPPPAA